MRSPLNPGRVAGAAAGVCLLTALAAPAAGPANVQSVTGLDLKKALAAQKGKVVVLNIWATTCEPCVKEFPELVKLYDTMKSKGLVVLAVSMDEPADKAEVIAFIEKQKATFPVYVRSSGSVDAYFDPVDKGWPGAMPTTYVFDRKGKVAGKPVIGAQSYSRFVQMVEPVLK